MCVHTREKKKRKGLTSFNRARKAIKKPGARTSSRGDLPVSGRAQPGSSHMVLETSRGRGEGEKKRKSLDGTET